MATGTREQLLGATGKLLQQRGFHGTSLNDILAESGAPRGSLYFHFPGGKAELAAEATRAEVAEATRLLRECLDAHEDPAEGVRAAFEAMAEWMEGAGFTVGCPIAPLVLDRAGDAPELAEIVRSGFADWHAMLQAALKKGGIGARRAAGLATLVLAAEEGAILLARAKRDAAPMRAAADELARAICAARGPDALARGRARRDQQRGA